MNLVGGGWGLKAHVAWPLGAFPSSEPCADESESLLFWVECHTSFCHVTVVLRNRVIVVDAVSGEAVLISVLKLLISFFYLWLNSNFQINSDFHLYLLFLKSDPRVHSLTDMSDFEGRTLNQDRLKCYSCLWICFRGYFKSIRLLTGTRVLKDEALKAKSLEFIHSQGHIWVTESVN